MRYVTVTPLIRLPRKVEQSFTYHTEEEISIGQIVLVKFRGRKILAVTRSTESSAPNFKTSPIDQPLSFTLSRSQKFLADSIVREYGSPDSLAYSTVVPNLRRKPTHYEIVGELSKPLINPIKQSLGGNQHVLLSGSYPDPTCETVKNFISTESRLGQILILVPDRASLDELHRHYPTAIRWDTSSTSLATENWEKISHGALIIIGTRTALFAPFKKLQAVIISDSTSELYRSRDAQPHYNVVSLAHQLSKEIDCRVLLTQALPSLAEGTGYIVAQQNKSQSTLYILERRAYSSDDRRMPLPASVIQSLKDASGRILLVINRRGYAALHCRECEYIHRCKKCDTPLTSPERSSLSLNCNQCGESDIAPTICPDCGSRTLAHMGFGIKRYREYLEQLLPTRAIIEISGENSESVDTQWHSLRTMPKDAIIIATVAILPRLWLLPDIHTSIIPRADHFLSLPSWRAAEDFLQLVVSLRTRTKSETFVEVNTTDYPVIQALKNDDFKSFWDKERALRQSRNLPPFGHSYVINSQTDWLPNTLPNGFTTTSKVNIKHSIRTVLSAHHKSDPTNLWKLLPNDAKVDVDPHSIV